MGGKTAMVMALENPQLVNKVVVVDVAPTTAPGTGETEDVVSILRSVDLSSVESRKEADSMMHSSVHESRYAWWRHPSSCAADAIPPCCMDVSHHMHKVLGHCDC